MRESEATLRSIFRAAPTGIGMVCNRVIQQANERLCKLTGYTREELLGLKLNDLYPETQSPKGENRLKSLKEKQQLPLFETYLLSPTAIIVWSLLHNLISAHP